jgi:hypothetical protein
MFLLRILFGAAFTVAASCSLGRVCLWRIRAPRIMSLPVGAAVLSLCVFLLMLIEAANEISFLALGVCALLPLLLRDKRPRPEEKREPLDRVTVWLLIPILSAYGILYLVHALAPELQPDALYYHLGLVSEYFRLGTFPTRIGFYEVLPQGMEMLYLFAFAFGEHPAAKLVHFAFLIATGPVLLALGRRLGISDTVCWIAAALYWLSPVVGISGTCAYTDAALVCCILATFYFLIAWRDEARAVYLIPAGLLAGFCYAIKLNALLIPALAGLFVLIACRRNLKLALASSGLLAAATLIMIAPWMIRSAVLTGNPLAPLFNAWFPNPYFLAVTDRNLAKYLRTYDGFKFSNAPWELTVGGISHGILGPLFLLLPVGLLSLRRSAGRWAWLAGGLLAIPWFINVGTRFLMPSLPFFALAFVLALPRPAAWAALVFHAVICWPDVIAHYQRPQLWRLGGFPWKAALRLQPDRTYLHSALTDFPVAEMLNRATKTNGRILALTALSDAYINREIIQYWQSATGVRLREELLEVIAADGFPVYDWTARWKEQRLRGLRFRTLAEEPFEWEIHEVCVLMGDDCLRVDPQWHVTAWPNLFEAVFAFDGNQASRWRTWEATSPGMYLELEFGTPTMASGVSLATHWPLAQAEIFGKTVDGRWTLLSNKIKAEPRPKENLRRETMRSLRRAGIDYILTPAEGEAHGNLIIGKDLAAHAKEYGIVEIDRYQALRLYGL